METNEAGIPAGGPPAAPPTLQAMERTEAVFAAPDQVTAELVRGALEAEGIPAVIGEQVADAYAGAFATGEGFWGEVRVAEGDAERARAVLAEYESGQGALSDDEFAAQAEAASDPQV